MVWSERSVQIANIIVITNNLLGNLDQEIKGRLNKLEKDLERNQKQEVEKDYESFKKGVIDQWKSLLREKAGQIIARYIVGPILKEGANHLVRYVGRKVGEAYQSYKESEYLEHFEELKQEYKEKLQSEQQCDNTSKTENHITEEYHKDLRKLMIKTRNPDLLADIVRENIPMDMTCVNACTQVVYKILKEQRVVISGLTIIVEGDGGIRQEFSSMSEGSERIIIPLELKDNHFEFCGSITSENSSESKNNCLYEALSEAIPGLRNIISPEGFRDKVANCIKHDKGIRYHIQQGWHRLPISLGAFGGASARKRSKVIHDFESSSFDNEEFLDYEEYQYRERNVSDHLEDRFTRFFRIGGIIQRASEQTNILRNQVVKSGSSKSQDQSSNKGREIHAAHVVRLGEINHEMVKQSEQLYNELVNFLGHTQNVPKYANEWHGIGGDIDKFQSRNLKELGKINFRESLTAEDASIIKSVKEDFIAVLDTRINRGKLSDRKKLELINVKTALTNITIESVFEKGKKGYSGEGMNAYR